MSDGPVHLSDTQGEAIRLIVDDVVYAIDNVHPLAGDLPPSDIELLPYAGEGKVKSAQDYPKAEIQFVGPDHMDAVVTAEPPSDHTADDTADGGLAFERDLALRQAKLAKATLQIVKWSLNENRPLRALDAANEELERLDEELDAFDELGEVRDGD